MRKGWDLGSANAGCTGKSSHSVVPNPYDWSPAGQPHAVYRVPTSTGEQRQTLEMATTVEVAMVHLQLPAASPPLAAVAPDPTPAWACSTSQ